MINQSMPPTQQQNKNNMVDLRKVKLVKIKMETAHCFLVYKYFY